MNIRKFVINMLPYDILMILIKFTCYRSILNLICVNKFFYNLYDELNKFKKDNMLDCASILITNGFKIYGGFCRDLINDVCPKKIDLFCSIKDNNCCSKIHNEYCSNNNNKFPFSNNVNKYIKNIKNIKVKNDDKALYKTTKSYFTDIFKNKISISDIIILKKYNSFFSIVVIIYFRETYIELHINFPDINDLVYDFWCNILVLSSPSINNKYNEITKKDILNVFRENKYTNKLLLGELIGNEKISLKNIIQSIKEKIAIPINKNMNFNFNNDSKYACNNINCQKNKITEKNYCNKYVEGFAQNNSIVKNNIMTFINKQSIYQNNNSKNNVYNINNCNCNYICFKKKFEISKKYICENQNKCHKYENNPNYYIYIFQKNFLKTELSGFKILMDCTYVNYKQIEWFNKNNIKNMSNNDELNKKNIKK